MTEPEKKSTAKHAADKAAKGALYVIEAAFVAAGYAARGVLSAWEKLRPVPLEDRSQRPGGEREDDGHGRA